MKFFKIGLIAFVTAFTGLTIAQLGGGGLGGIPQNLSISTLTTSGTADIGDNLTVAGDVTFDDGATTILNLDSSSFNGVSLRNDTPLTRAYMRYVNAFDTFELTKFDTDGSSIVGRIEFDNSGNIDVTAGTLQVGGVDVVTTANQTIVCTTACDVSSIAVGQSAIVKKPSNESTNTDTTLSDDTDLQFTSVPVGTYTLEGYIQVILATTTTQGFKYLMSGSNVGYEIGNCILKSTTLPSQTNTIGAFGGTTIQLTGTHINAANTNHPLTCQGFAVISSSTGSIILQWAQSSSNANNTSVTDNSWLRITRVE